MGGGISDWGGSPKERGEAPVSRGAFPRETGYGRNPEEQTVYPRRRQGGRLTGTALFSGVVEEYVRRHFSLVLCRTTVLHKGSPTRPLLKCKQQRDGSVVCERGCVGWWYERE